MRESEADRAFYAVYNGRPNILTPTILERGMIGDDCAYEISKGHGMYGHEIYAVSVLRRVQGAWATSGDSRMTGYTLASAHEYVDDLAKGMRV